MRQREFNKRAFVFLKLSGISFVVTWCSLGFCFFGRLGSGRPFLGCLSLLDEAAALPVAGDLCRFSPTRAGTVFWGGLLKLNALEQMHQIDVCERSDCKTHGSDIVAK